MARRARAPHRGDGVALVGGATRLTDLGLSITKWKPVTGAIPPMSDSAWQEAFDAYQKDPPNISSSNAA